MWVVHGIASIIAFISISTELNKCLVDVNKGE